MTWRIYYAGGATFSSDDGSPQDAPPWGVLCAIMQHELGGKYLLGGCDYYWHDGDGWLGGNLIGLIDRLAIGPVVVRMGRMVDIAEYEATIQRAREDPDFQSTGTWRQQTNR